MTQTHLDHERCYRAHASRDARFDGQFFTAVATTGIYCRPSCPARTPDPRNVTFLPTAAAAQALGYRACKRCRPDASPGSPDWDVRADVVARAMRMLADGAVERIGVAGVARALGYSERQLNRLVQAELGTGLLALARAQRARLAALLLAGGDLTMSEVAWAAGFSSIRAFNDTMQAVYGTTPSQLRQGRRGPDEAAAGTASGLTVRIAVREPFDAATTLGFLGARAVAGVEHWDGTTYTRTMDLPNGHARVCVRGDGPGAIASFTLCDLRDLGAGVARVRRMLDADADPGAILSDLGGDPLVGPLVAGNPGLRSPGVASPVEMVVRAIVGQQVSVAGARTVLGRIVAQFGEDCEVSTTDSVPTAKVFPLPAALAGAGPADLAMPASRSRALAEVCNMICDGRLQVGPGADRAAARAGLLGVRGVGAWTADCIAMRGFGDPDVMLSGDLGVRNGMRVLGGPQAPREIEALARRWRPWRSYAVHHLWVAAGSGASGTGPAAGSARRAAAFGLGECGSSGPIGLGSTEVGEAVEVRVGVA